FVDIGAELYAMSAVCVRARSMAGTPEEEKAIRLASMFCRQARLRVEHLFDRVFDNVDRSTYRLAQEVLAGDHAWLERGAIEMIEPGAILAPEAVTELARERGADLSETDEATQLAAGG